MTAPEYIQLKAFARIDGALLSVLWLCSFGCYVAGLTNPWLSMVGLLLIVLTPFFVAGRLRKFRDEALQGVISFLRAYAYSILIFFYAGILFAIAQYAYFAYLDQGFLLGSLRQMIESPEAAEAIKQTGMGDALNESLNMMGQMRPIDVALNMLSTNISIGIVLGLPIAALLYRKSSTK